LFSETDKTEDDEDDFQDIAFRLNANSLLKMRTSLLAELQLILADTKLNDNMRLARWKIRRFLDELAQEFSVKVPKLKSSLGKKRICQLSATRARALMLMRLAGRSFPASYSKSSSTLVKSPSPIVPAM
jgi:hypothetical protein